MTGLFTRTYLLILVGYVVTILVVVGTIYALNPLNTGRVTERELAPALARLVEPAPGLPPLEARVRRANMMVGPLFALLPLDLLELGADERAALRRGEVVRRSASLGTRFYRQVPGEERVLEAELPLPGQSDVLRGLLEASSQLSGVPVPAPDGGEGQASARFPDSWVVEDASALDQARLDWHPVVEPVDPLGLRLRVLFRRPLVGHIVATPPHWSVRRVTVFLTPPLTIGLSVLVVLLAMRPLRREVQRLSAAVRELGDGRLDRRLEGRDPIGLTSPINDMAERLESLVGEREALLQSVSHELRAPLARMSFQIERARSGAETDDALDAMQASHAEMTGLVEELLSYARLADDAPDIQREEVDLTELLEDLQARLPELDVAIPDAELLLRGDSRLLFRALENLGGNAVRYAGGGRVSVTADAALVQVVFDDDGPGIAPENRQAVFEPFFREEGSRSRASGGAGLGLAIVARIARRHGGVCRVEESSSGGARFVLAVGRG